MRSRRFSSFFFVEISFFAQSIADALKYRLIRAANPVQMQTVRQCRKRARMRAFQLFTKFVDVKPRKQVQRCTDLAVNRVLYGNINYSAAIVNHRIQFVRHMRLIVRACQRTLKASGSTLGGLLQNISARRGKNAHPACAHNCNISHNHLPAHRKRGSNRAGAQRFLCMIQQLFDLLTPFGCIH